MDILPGADCTTMAEVRAGVDHLDRALVALLARRFAYMDAAARIKPARGQVRDEARKAQVIANARAEAERAGLPGEAIAALWDQLVEASIAYELRAWDRKVKAGVTTSQARICDPLFLPYGEWGKTWPSHYH